MASLAPARAEVWAVAKAVKAKEVIKLPLLSRMINVEDPFLLAIQGIV